MLSHEELARKTDGVAEYTRGSEKQVVHAIANQIRSNAKLEESQNRFAQSTKKTETVMIILAVAQALLAIVSIIIALIK